MLLNHFNGKILWAPLLVVAMASCGQKDGDDEESDGFDLVIRVQSSASLALLDNGDEDSEDQSESQDEASSDNDEDNGADDNDSKSVSEKEIQQCDDLFETEVTGLKVAGNQNDVSVAPESAVAVKITGNKNTYTAQIKAAEEDAESPPEFEGICLVLAGNQATAEIDIVDVAVQKVKVVATGNSPTVKIHVGENGEIVDHQQSTGGSSATITIDGDGQY